MNRFTLKSTPTPSSEGTGLFCRVPWPEFSRAPWIIHPTHLSWFPVRFACPILRSFSRQHRLNNFRPFGHGLASQDREERICQLFIPTRLHRDNQRPACLSSCVPSSREHTSIPISYAFQPRLRGRLTPGRLPLPGKPWVYGERVFHPFYRYSCQHNHFSTVQHALRHTFSP